MCLRIKFCNHQWPGSTNLLKSLYPNVQATRLKSVYIRLALLQATKEDLEAEAEASRTRLQELLQERPLFSQLFA
jgi:hypothetical protein